MNIDTVREELQQRMKNLILSTCNTIGCKNCPYKFPEDENGAKCQSDLLQQQIIKLEEL